MKEQDEIYPALATDLYEFTMAKGYLDNKMENTRATFDLFIRSLPENWGFFITCGVDDAIDFLVNDFKFSPQNIAYLRDQGFPDDFLNYLRDMRFSGDVWAVPEGTPVGPNTPILRVTAPLVQAQLAETALLNLINFQTMIATKANRVARAAKGASVVDFGLRRAQGPGAGLKGARAAFIGGCKGTSNVEAGKRYGIPISGTQAHSWVMAFHSELDAFRAYATSFPNDTILLIDTYDVEEGAKNAAIVGKEMEARKERLKGVRIDSGDLEMLAAKVRKILDENNLEYVTIIGTSDLNEYKIEELVSRNSRIDGFGVGTELITGKPVAAVSGVYKLVQIEDRPVIKLSSGKVTYPGLKQVYRVMDDNGNYNYDLLALEGEKSINDLNGFPLLEKLVSKGHQISTKRNINDIQKYVETCVSKVPNSSLNIKMSVPYGIIPSSVLAELINDLKINLKQKEQRDFLQE